MGPLPGLILRILHQWYGNNLLVTTGLGAGGVLLAAWMRGLDDQHPVYFIDTGAHFPETLDYYDYLTQDVGLSIVKLEPEWPVPTVGSSDCCYERRVRLFNLVAKNNRAYVSALRREQSGERQNVEVYRGYDKELGLHRFCPLATATRKEIDAALEDLGIKQHPLRSKGYESIGCAPCTSPSTGGERSGRSFCGDKKECGIHF